MFHCLVIKVLNSPSLRQLFYFITFISACQVLFSSFFEAFLMFVCRSQATCLLYHILTGLSTTFFAFFKTFQIVCSEETILHDSSVRITLSNRAVNTFLNIFTIFFNFLIVLHNESNCILNPGYVDQIHTCCLSHG